ncbi:hypothetical protein CDLVIII_0061 [Clostridium sp. DL-VIII]|uniref:hypothetical protein n=1 Tax=Clostridium sp. DL-VIII TaxID=641107 RepID=UPI00023AF6E2|nr:hypothetical protein [Clostridium sp. DL-VIII]EHI96803.1 hypothetical protein CDLVIII_0061 [Clostridium sp. DL-VIII]
MISFIKSNSNILVLIFLLFLTVDSFLLIVKFIKRSETLPKLKISYDILKSYCFCFCNNKYKLAIINLEIENMSMKPIDITNIKLIDRSKTYIASIPKLEPYYEEDKIILSNEDKSKSISIDISSENILQNTSISPLTSLNGYAVFENFDPIIYSRSYKLVVETPLKSFETEVTINPLEDGLNPIIPEDI